MVHATSEIKIYQSHMRLFLYSIFVLIINLNLTVNLYIMIGLGLEGRRLDDDDG